MSHIQIDRILCTDAISYMANLPDKSIEVIMTDPVWPDCSLEVGIRGQEDPWELFRVACEQFGRLTDRLVVVLGCDTDPRFVSQVPACLPFVRTCWLRRIPGSYRGPIFYDADVAYVFGHKRLNGSSRVMNGTCSGRTQDTCPDGNNPHPCPRHLDHMRFLVRTFSRPGDLVFDPFAGVGTTLVAAKEAGRHWLGCEIHAEYADFARARVNKTATKLDLFHAGDEPVQSKMGLNGEAVSIRSD
jgi:hypothetical protein